jgi:hypothetical protein
MEAVSAEHLASRARRWHSSIKLVGMRKSSPREVAPWYGLLLVDRSQNGSRPAREAASRRLRVVEEAAGRGLVESRQNLAFDSHRAHPAQMADTPLGPNSHEGTRHHRVAEKRHLAGRAGLPGRGSLFRASGRASGRPWWPSTRRGWQQTAQRSDLNRHIFAHSSLRSLERVARFAHVFEARQSMARHLLLGGAGVTWRRNRHAWPTPATNRHERTLTSGWVCINRPREQRDAYSNPFG